MIRNNPNATTNSPSLNPKNLRPTKDLVNIIINIVIAKSKLLKKLMAKLFFIFFNIEI